MNELIGMIMGFSIGGLCRYFDLPVPAPPNLMGAFLVLSLTIGYIVSQQLV